MRNGPSNRFVFFLFIAAAIHSLLFWQNRPQWLADYFPKAESETPIEISQITQTEEAIEQTDKKVKSRFGGEFRQRVEKEMRTPLSGRFAQGKDSPVLGGVEAEPSENGESPSEKPSEPLALRDLMELSSNPNKFPDDIALGNRTVVNSDPVVYASFLNRVVDEIYGGWSSYARELTSELARVGKARENVFVTVLEVVMDDDGRLVSIDIKKSSGHEGYDEAAKRAFWDVDSFPNPPSQLKGPDGLLRIGYQFSFEVRSSGLFITPQPT